MALLLVLINPTLILIDHGHFQYNSLSLGLAQLAIGCILTAANGGNKRQLLLYASAAALFVMALNYKQMELYHALPFFFYLLGVCLKQDSIAKSLLKLAAIGATVVVSFLVIWAPFLLLQDTKLELAFQVLHRIFPLSRGLFEVKAAIF